MVKKSATLCGLLLTCFVLSKSQNSVFLSKKYGLGSYVCVTNSSYALSWIDSDIGERLQYASSYIPIPKENFFDCNIKYDQNTRNHFLKDQWSLQNSISSRLNDIILDERWEDMQVRKTEFVDKKGLSLKYNVAANISASNFEIPLSIRTEKEAHIFLCDGNNPPESNCYWLLLQAFSGTASSIRKCSNGQIPSKDREYPMSPCKDRRVNMTHPPYILSNKEWFHFVLSKQNNMLSLSHISDTRSKLLEWEDIENPIRVTNLIIHSKVVNGLWKIHNLVFMYTDKADRSTQLGPPIQVFNNSVCISMYIAMCSSCKLRLSLITQTKIIHQIIFKPNHSGWNYFKFITDNVFVEQVWFDVYTMGLHEDSFWAIDKVRLCQKQEFRMLALTEKADCQLMTRVGSVIQLMTGNPSFSSNESKCPENTIGDFCMPCDMTFGNCKQITICTRDKCVCSAGYKDKECYYECDRGTYGHGCQQRCGNCYYKNYCNNIDGACTSCAKNFSGPKCDIPISIFFSMPPHIENISYTEVIVSVSNFTINDELNNQQIQFYTLQYKKAQDNEWITIKNSFQFNMTQNFKIDKLDPETEYFVRGVIILENNQWQVGDHLKYSTFTTTCQDISENNINVTVSNITAYVSLIETTYVTCKQYSVSLFENKDRGYINGSVVFFHNLTPFTDYTVIFKRNELSIQKKIRTLEGVPTKIKSFTTKTLSSTSIELKWTKPIQINGEFRYYSIDYKLLNNLGCASNFSSLTKIISQTSKDTSVNISDLTPYSTYTFNIYAVNTKFMGPSYVELAKTDPSKNIEKEEIPAIIEKEEITSIGAKIILSEVNCTNSRGPLIMNLSTTCNSLWCEIEDKNPKTEIRDFASEFRLNKLLPFTNYSLQIKFCREESCSETQIKTFTTKPAEPLKVRNLVVYTKNSSSISLKWEQPYPPYGILEKYKLMYDTKEVEIEITSCKIWPYLHCAVLSNLIKNRVYRVQLSARNKDPNNFGEYVEATTVTKIGQPNSPYDLNIEWILNNNLKLEWKHPNETNGNIEYFAMEIISENSDDIISEILYVSEETYNLTYYFQINGTKFMPTTLYETRVYAYNGLQGFMTSKKSTSPPDIPRLATKTQLQSSNTTITVTLSLQKLRGSSDGYKIYVIRSGEGKSVSACDASTTTTNFIIFVGQNQTDQYLRCNETGNSPLNPGTLYNITISVQNTYGEESRERVFSYQQVTQGEQLPSELDSSLFGLLALLLLIPLVAVLYLKRDKLMKNNFFTENNTSAELLDVQDEQVPLSHVDEANILSKSSKKGPKIQPKPQVESIAATKVYSKPIKITEFEKYVKESIRNGELERQHALFPRGQTKSWKYGTLKENKSKNRYNNLIAYDHTRVILEKISGQPHSDYINANYIDGHKINKAYIATQGPKAATLNDFWRMIWQENVRHIANLANIYEGGKKKLEKYWPDINEMIEFGEITVQHVTTNVFADYEHRIFTVTHNDESRKIQQLHFSSWPDHGVPLYSQSLVPFLQKILQIPLTSKSPVLVHCSAGVGRTGTILLCDISLRMAAREGTIDALRSLQHLRDQRANMVDNIEQYKLAHLVVLECLAGLHTSIPCNEIDGSVEKLLRNETLIKQMKYLKDTQWQDQAMKTVGQMGEEQRVVREKNRFEEIIPEIQGRVFISRNLPQDETSSYINAVKVDGFRCSGRFIVTQQPMPNTLGDFWRLIDEYTTTSYAVVISLNEINPQDKTSCYFWPTESHTDINPVPHITLKHISTLSLECYDVVTVHLCTDSRKDNLPVQIVSMKNWEPRISCPRTIEEFLTFWEQTNSNGRGTSPVFVTCYDGVTASGLFVAMSFIIEKMKLEQVCDVCQAVRNIRHNRPQFVQEIEQFEFLYKAAVLYINGFESYANFT